MEARKITIISTRNNKRTVINTDATTLGELKEALRQAGVDYDGMTFYEGLTKIELKLDSSLLPHDVQRINPVTREPETTNELAFMLTNTNKKIRSGAVAMSRSEVYDAIKNNNLQAECLKRFGKNFTMCKTADLVSLVNSKSTAKSTLHKPAAHKTKPAEFVDLQARAAINRLVSILYWEDTLNDQEKDDVLNILRSSTCADNSEPSLDSPYSDDELSAMFIDIPK